MGCCVARSKPTKCKPIISSEISEIINLSSNFYTGIHDTYEFIRVLGHGQYGVVREAKKIGQVNSRTYAIKSISKNKINKHKAILKRELQILMYVDHPNIIKLYETYEDELYLHLVMELCTGGDVFERLIKRGTFSEREAAEIMKQVFGAVNYLHLKNISHRDLKPDNFLYVSKESSEIKLCDFGTSIKSEDSLCKLKSLAGTPYYLAPEILKGSYTSSCDIWSLGVFLYFILVGNQPFNGTSFESIYKKSSRGASCFQLSKLTNVSSQAKDLIKKLLNTNPSKRIKLQEALSHPWINENTETKLNLISVEALTSIASTKQKTSCGKKP